MSMQFKPSSLKVLCYVNAAFVYCGGLFIYMGTAATTAQLAQVFQSTIMLAIAKYFVGGGCIIVLGGVAGTFVVFNRNEKNLKRHRNVLVVVASAFLVSTVLSLVLFLAATSDLIWSTTLEPTLSENYATEICPNTLGFVCHGVSTSNVFVYPQYQLVFQYYSSELIAKYKAVLSIPNEPSAPFSKLCVNVSERMNLLPPMYAFNLNSSCQMCANVSPSYIKPQALHDNSDLESMGCRSRLFGGKFPIATYMDKDKVHLRETSSFGFLSTLNHLWRRFASAMAIASAGFSTVALVQLYEVHRTLREFLIAQAS